MSTFKKNSGVLKGFLLAILLSACAGATVLGAGCSAYAEARLDIPWDELSLSPHAVVAWVNLLDARMTGVCLN